jgi:hypothetical protein
VLVLAAPFLASFQVVASSWVRAPLWADPWSSLAEEPFVVNPSSFLAAASSCLVVMEPC